MIRIEEGILRNYVSKILSCAGLSDRHNDLFTDYLVETDAYGVHTHGLNVLKAHVDRIERGGYSLTNEPFVLKETAAFSVVDAQKTIGAVSASFCMNKAIAEAESTGLYSVFCRNSNTFGAAFYYSLLAVQKGMIGICFCNTPPAMTAWNGKKKILGTNPFSIGIPGCQKGPIIFDMATSIVARSKIIEAKDRNELIPEGWAVDEFGNPTTNPISAIRGAVLPMAEHKGYGIAMAIDMVAGMLSGAAYLDDVKKFYSSDDSSMNVGACFIVINPKVVDSEQFYHNTDLYIDRIHESGPNVRFPGEERNKKREKSSIDGIELSEKAISDIIELLKRYGLESFL